MIKVDLITGFLGSGKTTFLKKYARYFMDQGQRVGILENDYGAVNVDMLLLNELRGENCELEMVAGACDRDCHKRRFKTKLISMGMSGYDRVIIEPSGIFDVDEFFDSLREDPLERWYEIGNVIAIVDARLENSLSEVSDYYLASQLANAGTILLSRTQLATPEEIENTISHIESACDKAKLNKNIRDIIVDTPWDDFTNDSLSDIARSEYRICSYAKLLGSQENVFSTLYFLEVPFTKELISEKTAEILGNPELYGNIIRIKGFFQEDNQWFEINATKNELDIKPISVGQSVLIVIGEHLNEDALNEKIRHQSLYEMSSHQE